MDNWMNRLGLVVFATFVLTAPCAQAIDCDDLTSVLTDQATEMRKFSEQFGAIEGDYTALCQLGREQGLPYLKASLKNFERFVGDSPCTNIATKAITLQQKIIAEVEESVASDCKAAGM
jgi:hypothetical protein